VTIKTGDETSMVAALAREADVQELVTAIGTQGFLPFDEMIATEEPKNSGKYVVLEGNRRLAALKILTDPKLAKELRLSVPSIDYETMSTFDPVPVRVVESAAEARNYIGFKHVNGPHKWDAIAKAQFAAKWIDDGGSIEQIARTLGDTNDTVRRLLIGLKLVGQAERFDLSTKDVAKSEFPFAYLYTAATLRGLSDHIGLRTTDDDGNLVDDPVPSDKREEFRQLWFWLFGSKSLRKDAVVRRQNPDLYVLNRVMQSPQAKDDFLTFEDLERAQELIESAERRFADALKRANDQARRATGLLPEYDGSYGQAVRQSEELARSANYLAEQVRAIHEEASSQQGAHTTSSDTKNPRKTVG